MRKPKPSVPRHMFEPENSLLSEANAALDRIESDARLIIEAGGEAALRTRLERVLGEARPADFADPYRCGEKLQKGATP